MLTGHFGAALLVKATLGRHCSLPMLFLFSQLQDLFFFPLYALGIEWRTQVPHPRDTLYGLKEIHAPYSHSLFTTVLLVMICGAVFARKARIAYMTVVLSHWILDLLTHYKALHLCWPFADCGKVGLGVFSKIQPGIVAECGMVIIGAVCYALSVPKSKVALKAVLPLVVTLCPLTFAIPYVPDVEMPLMITFISFSIYALWSLMAWRVQHVIDVQCLGLGSLSTG